LKHVFFMCLSMNFVVKKLVPTFKQPTLRSLPLWRSIPAVAQPKCPVLPVGRCRTQLDGTLGRHHRDHKRPPDHPRRGHNGPTFLIVWNLRRYDASRISAGLGWPTAKLSGWQCAKWAKVPRSTRDGHAWSF